MKRLLGFVFALFALLPVADAREIVDLAGRRVSLPDRVERILLGEGRMLISLGVVRPREPLKGVVGMMGEYPLLDPAGFAEWQRRYPEVNAIPLIGKASGDTFNAETAISLKPDVAIFALAGHGPGPTATETVDRLEAAGIRVVFVDFFRDPLINTPKSIRVLGEILDGEAQAEAFAETYAKALATVTGRVAKIERRPLVFLENRVGLQADCCASVGNTVLGNMIAQAGGRNLAADLIPGNTGVVSLEYLLTHQPEIYVGTAIGNPDTRATQPGRIQMGPGVTADAARASLRASLARDGIADLDAVRGGRAHAIWHHFFHSPFNVVAVQAMAKWFHPQAFADVDPEATLADFQRRFQPFVTDGTYWMSAR